MRSFPVPVLSFLFVSFRSSLLRFPQPFHRCFPFAFAFGLFRFPSASFRPLLLRFQLLSLCFFLSAFFPFPPHSGFPGAPLPLTLLRLSPFFPARFPVPSFPVLVLGFLFVSFHPSRFRSHSRSTGASLLFRFLASTSLPGFSACFPVSLVPFSLLLTTQPPALSFPLFPTSPGSGSFGALRFLASPLLSSDLRPVSMPSFRFRYSAFCISFLRSLFRLTVATSAPGLLFPARPFPFAFALGSGYLACPF